MLTFDQIKLKLSAVDKKKLPMVSDKSGVPFNTLIKIYSGVTKNPQVLTAEMLSDYFQKKKRRIL